MLGPYWLVAQGMLMQRARARPRFGRRRCSNRMTRAEPPFPGQAQPWLERFRVHGQCVRKRRLKGRQGATRAERVAGSANESRLQDERGPAPTGQIGARFGLTVEPCAQSDHDRGIGEPKAGGGPKAAAGHGLGGGDGPRAQPRSRDGPRSASSARRREAHCPVRSGLGHSPYCPWNPPPVTLFIGAGHGAIDEGSAANCTRARRG